MLNYSLKTGYFFTDQISGTYKIDFYAEVTIINGL